MPKKVGLDASKRWAPSRTGLWVAGAEIFPKAAAPHDAVRAAFKAVDAHLNKLRELYSVNVTFYALAERPRPPARLAAPFERLDGGSPESFTFYDTSFDDELEDELDDGASTAPTEFAVFADPFKRRSGAGTSRFAFKMVRARGAGVYDGASTRGRIAGCLVDVPKAERGPAAGWVPGYSENGSPPPTFASHGRRAEARFPSVASAFWDARRSGELTAALAVLDKFADIDADDWVDPGFVVAKIYPLDARCRAALAWTTARRVSLAQKLRAKRKFLASLAMRSYGLEKAHVDSALKASLDKKHKKEPLPDLDNLTTIAGDDFDYDFRHLGLDAVKTPFLIAGGKIVELGLDPEAAAKAASSAVSRAAARDVDDDGPEAPFYNPALTPSIRIRPEAPPRRRETLFRTAFPHAAAPAPGAPTLYSCRAGIPSTSRGGAATWIVRGDATPRPRRG